MKTLKWTCFAIIFLTGTFNLAFSQEDPVILERSKPLTSAIGIAVTAAGDSIRNENIADSVANPGHPKCFYCFDKIENVKYQLEGTVYYALIYERLYEDYYNQLLAPDSIDITRVGFFVMDSAAYHAYKADVLQQSGDTSMIMSGGHSYIYKELENTNMTNTPYKQRMSDELWVNVDYVTDEDYTFYTIADSASDMVIFSIPEDSEYMYEVRNKFFITSMDNFKKLLID